MPPRFVFKSVFLGLSGLFLSFVSLAQEPEVRTRDDDDMASVVVYDSEYFAPYNPITAEDMLNRIPGTEGLLGNFGQQQEERRGLRSNTDQILIDGKRLTGKENQSSSFLEKLPAKAVERIELITGNVRELDTDVGVRVINVVLKEGAGTGSGVAQIGAFTFSSGQSRPMGSVAYNGSSGDLSYTVSAQVRPSLSPADVIDVIQSPAGDRLSVIEEERRQKQAQYEARGALTYNWEGGQTLQVNGLVTYFPRNNTDTTTTFLDPGDGSLNEAGTIVDRIRGDDTTWEISGDYSQSLSKSMNFTGLFIYSQSTVDRDNENFSRIVEDLLPLGGDTRAQTSTEKILRGTINWNIAKKHDLELGVEGAINTLDKDLGFFSVVNNLPVDIPIINSDQKITEDRVEAFTTHSWKPIYGLEIETGVAAEYSSLTQIGSDVGTERTFTFVKPSLDIWYNTDPATQVWFSARRDVGQLDFDDFVATVNREDNEVLSGNPELAPEKSWDFEIGAERRLSDGAGVINGRVFYRRVDDVKDLIPFGLTDSQPGNLGSGDHYGAELETSIRFGRFTSVDAVLSGSVLVQDSKVQDPFTGINRRFGNQPEYELSLEGRHDVKSLGLSYGFDFSKKGPTLESDYNEFDLKATTVDMRLFLEQTITQGTILRMFWANMLKVTNKRERTIFAPNQASGIVDRVAFREDERGWIAGFRLRTTF
ncbi:MAG: TonB-dependent receptor [Rhodospirillaceae bacterium]|jgi:outer membrane receptor for ferrienterochelin and colicin|nr:TonB-dependent receptor [Rhodospirillaceae bacterium]MBT5564222.1 TonB-dependent receptor [Rhodospirillaceae bacterium]MBT6088787.1 TonB-dependent receptor [Rhodospirillaceae bacterium]MBT7449765.1 TonB-dependent receptor [Rhodospirillaceae bacterium]